MLRASAFYFHVALIITGLWQNSRETTVLADLTHSASLMTDSYCSDGLLLRQRNQAENRPTFLKETKKSSRRLLGEEKCANTILDHSNYKNERN